MSIRRKPDGYRVPSAAHSPNPYITPPAGETP